MSWTLDGKFRIHARLSNTSYMHLYSRTSVSLRRLYIGQFLSLHFKDRDEDVLSKGSKDILHYNKIFSCTMELPNDSASLVLIFVFIWDASVTCFNQKCPKSFCSYDKNKLFSYDIIRGIQQARSISFLSFFRESTRDSKENTFCTLWEPIRAQVFLLARGSHHNVEIAEKLGKRVNKSENFNPRTTMTTISWSRMKTKPRQRHD